MFYFLFTILVITIICIDHVNIVRKSLKTKPDDYYVLKLKKIININWVFYFFIYDISNNNYLYSSRKYCA